MGTRGVGGRTIGRAIGLLLAMTSQALAFAMIDTEEQVADLLATPRDVEEEGQAGRRWAVLPQVGYGPETGPLVGAKFTHRDLFGLGATFDLDGTIALEEQQSLALALGTPHLGGDRFLALFEVRWDTDPQVDFFGIGNNDLGPDVASTHGERRVGGAFTLGWRPWPRLAVGATVALRHVRIRGGDRDDDTPITTRRFPDLPGIDGGMVNPFELFLVYSSRDDAVLPTRGWRSILKVSHTDRELASDFEYTRFVLDAAYLRPVWGENHILAGRLGGSYVDGPSRDVPFWELAELGGSDTLRGFFPYRFRGTSHVLGNLEYRFRVTEFDFFDIWRVRVFGVVFGEAGRVFIDSDEVADEFALDDEIVERIVDDLQYSYGPGIRFVLSRALVARIDVGFSNEETGLVYLAFGHTF